MSRTDFNTLLEAGAHFGHLKRKWNPKMAPYIPDMCTTIASDLECDLSQINVKATTTEKLGFTGRKEGIAVEAVVLLVKL